MGNEVKRYDTTLLGTDMPPCVVSATDFDALRAEAEAWKSTAWERLKRVQTLHAEGEALRAENERLEVRAAQAYMKGHGDASNVMIELEAERDQLHAELEALRSQHAERQEAAAWRVSISGMWQYFNTQAEAQAEYDQCHAGDEDYAEYSPEPLYAAPPPAQDAGNPELVSYAEDMSTCTLTCGDGIGYFYNRVTDVEIDSPTTQDVSGLVEALELADAVTARIELSERIKSQGLPPHSDYWCQSIFMADKRVANALAAYRKAAQ